jgi:hypothetical protein
MKSLRDHAFNGREALGAVIAQSEYETRERAVAALSVFSHPITVQQVHATNVLRVVRARGTNRRGTFGAVGNEQVMFDDNWSPKQIFDWSNDVALSKKDDLQFNHIVSKSEHVTHYTNLANIVVLPAFLSKLTDTDENVKAILFYRSLDLYGFELSGPFPKKPSYYESLVWADPLPPVQDLEQTLRKHMSTKPKNRAVVAARTLGWYFSNFLPDSSL